MFTFKIFIKETMFGLSPFYTMFCDQGFQKVTWFSLHHGLHTANHGPKKSSLFFNVKMDGDIL